MLEMGSRGSKERHLLGLHLVQMENLKQGLIFRKWTYPNESHGGWKTLSKNRGKNILSSKFQQNRSGWEKKNLLILKEGNEADKNLKFGICISASELHNVVRHSCRLYYPVLFFFSLTISDIYQICQPSLRQFNICLSLIFQHYHSTSRSRNIHC